MLYCYLPIQIMRVNDFEHCTQPLVQNHYLFRVGRKEELKEGNLWGIEANCGSFGEKQWFGLVSFGLEMFIGGMCGNVRNVEKARLKPIKLGLS